MEKTNQRIVLGINEEHDAGCSLVINGQIVAAYQEERYSRIKQHNGQSDGMPHRSLAAILKDFNIKPNDIDYVTCNFSGGFYLLWQVYKKLFQTKCFKWIFSGFLQRNFHGPGDYIYPFFYVTRKRLRLGKLLKKHGISPRKIVRVDHHVAHAAGAYYTSGFQKALVLTLDGHGSGLSGSISVGDGPNLFRKATVSKYNSVGLLYSMITAALGFKPGRHEGKILGLAAFGNPEKYREKFRNMISCKGLDIDLAYMRKYPSPIYPHFLKYTVVFKQEFPNWDDNNREELCASLQERVEEVIVGWARNAIKAFGVKDLVVAGGVFANVKVNQRLAEMPESGLLHVFPAMSDVGLASGSALYVYYKKFSPEKNITEFKHAFLDKEYPGEEIKNILDRLEIPYERSENIARDVAGLLDQGKVVARYNGKMEYGPRALGNRSVLYNGRDKSVNKWLNNKLDRTEFMPFAPVTLHEDANLYYKGIDTNRKVQPATFMTVTFNCTEKMNKDCPAAVHVDNTARPQIIRREDNPTYYDIINEYKKICGSSTIVNTSFNVHEEPIVNSPRDAIRSFLFTRLDALAIGDYLVLKENL